MILMLSSFDDFDDNWWWFCYKSFRKFSIYFEDALVNSLWSKNSLVLCRKVGEKINFIQGKWQQIHAIYADHFLLSKWQDWFTFDL